jgi:DNA-binding transcriptional MocR family regulator
MHSTLATQCPGLRLVVSLPSCCFAVALLSGLFFPRLLTPLPPHSTFPFTSLCVTLQDGTPVALSVRELEDAQQYCMSDDRGYKPLVEYLSSHVAEVHAPPHPCHVAISCGNTSALDCVLRSTCRAGDVVLVEEYCYAPALQLCAALGLVVHQVACDAQGPCVVALQQLLETHGGAIKAFYAVPVSANPTGVTWSQARKQEVYEIAAKHNVLLIEDGACVSS